MVVAAIVPVRAIEPASRWPSWKLTLLRINEYLCDRAASLGKSSVKRTPGVRVAIVASGPRYSAGALGLGSNRSRWLGPPPSQTRRIDRARPFPEVASGDWPFAGMPAAKGAAAPILRNARRDNPWHVRVQN